MSESNQSRILSEIISQHAPGRLQEVQHALERAGSSDHVTCLFPDHADTDPSFRFLTADDTSLRFQCTCPKGSGGLAWFLCRLLGWALSRAETEIAQTMGRLGIKPLDDVEIERLRSLKDLEKETRQTAQIEQIHEILSQKTKPPLDYLWARLSCGLSDEQLAAIPLSGRANLQLHTGGGEAIPSRALDVTLVDEAGQVVGLQTCWLHATEPWKLGVEPAYIVLWM